MNINVDEAMLEDLKKGAADGSERVDKESIVTSDSGNIQDLLRDAGFAPAPPWQSGKRAVRKAARCRACEVSRGVCARARARGFDVTASQLYTLRYTHFDTILRRNYAHCLTDAACGVAQFVVGMLDEKLMNALSDRTKEMPEPDAAIEPVGEEEFHAMLDAVCTDAELYVETLWESGARTSTGKRDLEFLAAGSRIKAGQDMVRHGFFQRLRECCMADSATHCLLDIRMRR